MLFILSLIHAFIVCFFIRHTEDHTYSRKSVVLKHLGLYGMFAALVETGSVMATFAGHDHDIDYLAADRGICLGDGRFSGDDTTYNTLRPGVRLLVLTEGERGFETWIREDDGRKVDHARFADGRITEIPAKR